MINWALLGFHAIDVQLSVTICFLLDYHADLVIGTSVIPAVRAGDDMTSKLFEILFSLLSIVLIVDIT